MNLKIYFLLIIGLWTNMPDACYAFLEKDVHLLNMQNGLADNTISAIYKDKEGFIWFGTCNGLSRYDGRQVTNFELRQGYPGITDVKEVFDGMLAFINDRVVEAFDLREERFIPVVSSSGKVIMSRGILQKNDSLLWLISGNELLLMERNLLRKDKLQLHVRERYSGWGSHSDLLVSMAYSSDGRKICLVDEKCRILLVDATDPTSFQSVDCGFTRSVNVNAILYDNDCVWISTIGHGIIYYNERTGKIKRLTYSILPSSDSLSHTDVFSIVRLNENKYLAVTWNGYTVLTVDKNNQDEISTDIYSNTSSLIHRNIETRMISVYYDSHGILWIGTDGGGVIWSDLRMQFYNRFYQDRHNEICSIVADDAGYVWLATYHQGIMRSLNPFDIGEKMDFSLVKDENVRRKQTVLCSLKDAEGNLWFGNLDGSLTCYHKQKRSFNIVTLITDEGLPNKLPVWTLFMDSKGHFWMGTQQGLFLVDHKNGTCRKIRFKDSLSDGMSPPYIRAIVETTDGNLWLGSANYGLCKVINENELYTGYEEKQGMEEHSVRSLLASSDGDLYIGYMTGFAIFSLQQNKIIRNYTTRDGLCSNFIGCLTEDETGQIWLGSNSGISRYSRHQHLFYNYYIAGSNRSALHYKNTLLWGNNKNLTYFNPDDIKAFTTSEAVVITGLEVNNKRVEIGKPMNGQVILSQSIFYTSSVCLNHENRDFSLTFNNLSYSEGQQKYSYRLSPYQHDWLVANGGERVSYVNLPVGEYTFEVKNIYPDEREGKVTTLKVEILPHWSETYFFRFCLMAFAAGAVLLIIHRIKLRQKRLEHELQLEHEVFTATVERDKEKQIRLERENFFTNAAHELRTPLTLILSPLQELLSAINPSDKTYDQLSIMYRNGTALQTLVDHLLYVQKIEAGMITLKISEVDIVALAKEVTDSFRAMAEAKGFNFTVELLPEPLLLWIDVEKIISAIRNLLSNAFKYTSRQGNVAFIMHRIEIDGYSFCSLTVSDTGKGIPEELQGRIFESFITGENTPLFSNKIGIGLRIVKNTMDLHHGSVTLDSVPEKGSTFRLLIPEGNAHFAEDKYEVVNNASETENRLVPIPVRQVENADEKPISKKSLLIIEDNEEIRYYICNLFRKEYILYEASNGEEGVQTALEKSPHLIISDIMMPVKDGFACCKEVREHPRTAHIPILMLTAKAEDADMLHASRVGADDYMMKPFNPEILKSKVRNLILQRERLKRIYTKTLMLKQQPENAPNMDAETTDDFIQQVIRVIEANLSDENFNVKMLADQMNMSQPTLYRKIKQRSELAAIDMIRSVRMSKAASLLMENRYTMQEITEMVGYSDTRTLRKHFTEQFGVSPSKYIDKE